jgi:hypothetical protein
VQVAERLPVADVDEKFGVHSMLLCDFVRPIDRLTAIYHGVFILPNYTVLICTI